MSQVDIYDARNAAQIERLRMEEAIKRSIETAERDEAWRMKRAMMKFAHHLKMEGAVLTVQRMWRGHACRSHIVTLRSDFFHRIRREEWDDWVRNENAITIQRMWRGHAERKRTRLLRRADSLLDSCYLWALGDEIEDEDDVLFYSAAGDVA